MKSLILKSIVLAVLFLNTQARVEKETIYECIDNKSNPKVDRVFINTFKKGNRTYFEAVVHYYLDYEERVMTKRLNFVSDYDGNMVTYSRGNIMIKIYKIMGRDKKYDAFVRIYDLGVHSKSWTCKEY